MLNYFRINDFRRIFDKCRPFPYLSLHIYRVSILVRHILAAFDVQESLASLIHFLNLYRFLLSLLLLLILFHGLSLLFGLFSLFIFRELFFFEKGFLLNRHLMRDLLKSPRLSLFEQRLSVKSRTVKISLNLLADNIKALDLFNLLNFWLNGGSL
jgi:hypothetical protein